MKSSDTRLNWRRYQPADEREYELYSQAYRRSYQFLVAFIISIAGFYKIASMDNHLTSVVIYGLLMIYVIGGLLLAEWVGSRVFIGQQVSFSKKRLIGIESKLFSGMAILVVYILFSYILVGGLTTWI